MEKKINLKVFMINSASSLEKIEKEYRKESESMEYMPWANGTSFKEIAETIIPDKNGTWNTPLYFTKSMHRTTIGIRNLCYEANEYIKEMSEKTPIDILSISASMENGRIILKVLVRQYEGQFNFTGFFKQIKDELVEPEVVEIAPTSGILKIPDEIKDFQYTQDEINKHDKEVKKQNEVLNNASFDTPFLNNIDKYVPRKLQDPSDNIELIYDLKTSDMKIKTIGDYEDFNDIFKEVMSYVNGVEYYHYVHVMEGEKTEKEFMEFLENYIKETYVVTNRLCQEDVPVMMAKLYRSLFQLYIIQDLIDDPEVTDIKITAPDEIRARVKGKAYLSNITFIDKKDYIRFINGIAIRNGILQNVPSQTFTDTNDEDYIMRFSISSEYVNAVDWPYLHIRKISRKKMLGDDLIKAGMLNEKIRDYLLDCGRNSRGVVFAGPPGSGKTVALNWFLEEAYELSAEILVIQENDELFTNRKGVMFQHVVNYYGGDEQPVNLEQLGQLALVAGANVFIIGEAKGAEICSAITLSNSGCRTAITIHSPSSTETVDKMADLAMRGYAQSYEQAKRMLKSFQTIVYLEDFKVKEISEIIGYNEEKEDMEYRYIYRDM